MEDDPNLGSLLCQYLGVKGYEVSHAQDGESGAEAYAQGSFDFIILDVMMPKKDGFTLAEEIRQRDKDTPILFLTAKTMKADTLRGLKIGADDYMTKPFSMEELLLRIQAIMRRVPQDISSEYDEPHGIGSFDFDPHRQILEREGDTQKLTTKESQLLQLLSKHRNGTLDRSEALMHVWGNDTYHNGRSMDVYITKLRKHLKADENLSIINVHGQGFRLIID